MAMMTTLAGVIIVLVIIVKMLAEFFETMKVIDTNTGIATQKIITFPASSTFAPIDVSPASLQSCEVNSVT